MEDNRDQSKVNRHEMQRLSRTAPRQIGANYQVLTPSWHKLKWQSAPRGRAKMKKRGTSGALSQLKKYRSPVSPIRSPVAFTLDPLLLWQMVRFPVVRGVEPLFARPPFSKHSSALCSCSRTDSDVLLPRPSTVALLLSLACCSSRILPWRLLRSWRPSRGPRCVGPALGTFLARPSRLPFAVWTRQPAVRCVLRAQRARAPRPLLSVAASVCC